MVWIIASALAYVYNVFMGITPRGPLSGPVKNPASLGFLLPILKTAVFYTFTNHLIWSQDGVN